MQIQCSQCAAKYLVPDHAIGAGGRKVRCAKCGHNWFVAPPAASAAPGPVLVATPPPIEAEPSRPRPTPKGSNLPALPPKKAPLGLKIAPAFILAATLPLMLLLWKPSVYGQLPSDGLVLAEVSMLSRFDEKHPERKHPTYEVTGKILNVSDETLTVPVLRISVIDKKGETLQFWDFSEAGRTLESKKNIPFSSGPLAMKFNQPHRFIVELGSPLELWLRKKPE